MSVLLEFSINGEDFPFGQALAFPSGIQLELEQIVPTGNQLLPFIWADGSEDELDEFEQSSRSGRQVAELILLDRLANARLYEITWRAHSESLIDAFVAADGTIFECRRLEGVWHFTVRFSDHESVTGFHNFLTERDIAIHMDKITSLTESERGGYVFGLTPEQREVLVEAVVRGHFLVPRETDLEDIAELLDISPQAASERIRRGTDAILRKVLLGD